MTCAEFRALLPPARFRTTTTAERAAWVGHYGACPACRALAHAQPDGPLTAEDEELIEAMLDRDLRDPEGLGEYRP